MEQRKEVKVELIIMRCDDCLDGEMLPNGMVLTVCPPRYTHRCNICGYTTNYSKTYPTTEYIALD